MGSRWATLACAGAALVWLGACAARTAPPVVTAPRHPEFVFPRLPDGAGPALRAGVERGWQYLQGGDLRSAEREFTTAIKAGPASASAETAMGYLRLARGEPAVALPYFDGVLARDAAYVPALVGRGQTLVDLRREGEALASLEAALKIDPSLSDLQARVDVLRFRATQDLLARAKAAAEAGRLDEARVAYGQAIAASPDSAFLYRDRALVERRAGLLDEAMGDFRRAIDLDPTDARAIAALGELMDERDDAVAALALFEKARAIDPSAVLPATLARARDRAALLKLPAQVRAIPTVRQVTRADVAALVGIRLEGLINRAAQRQVVITDVRGHWAQAWITAVVRASVMDTQANYQFDPGAPVRRGDLARVVSRVLGLINALRPAQARTWESARLTITDVAPAHLSYPAVSMAVASGVMPLEGGAFRLLDPVSGAEAVEVVGRLEALAR